VVTGSLIALLSLLQHVPVWVASLRGGLAFLVLVLVLELGLSALGRTLDGGTRKVSGRSGERA
jgi:hypothetical protein